MFRLSKMVLNIFRLLAILVSAGLLAFWGLFWPAPDQVLDVSQQTLASLLDLRNRTKYVEIPGSIYNGMRPESRRVIAEAQLNSLIDRLRDGLPSRPSKKFVLSEFAKTMEDFESIDTEDREQLLRYLEEIMHTLGIENSDGLLSRWMYGPLLGPLAERLHRKP
jgi:Domain of unknown function (DUF4844)